MTHSWRRTPGMSHSPRRNPLCEFCKREPGGAAVPETSNAAGASGLRALQFEGVLRRVRPGVDHPLPQFLTPLAPHGRADLREPLVLFLLHVVADVLGQHRDLRVDRLFVGVEVEQFGQHPHHDVVLLHALQDVVLRLRHRLARRRVEDLLLDVRVDGQLLDDRVGDAALLVVSVLPRLLELLEQLLHGLVVVLEQHDRVGRHRFPHGVARSRRATWEFSSSFVISRATVRAWASARPTAPTASHVTSTAPPWPVTRPDRRPSSSRPCKAGKRWVRSSASSRRAPSTRYISAGESSSPSPTQRDSRRTVAPASAASSAGEEAALGFMTARIPARRRGKRRLRATPSGYSADSPRPGARVNPDVLTFGIEEEFFVVDLRGLLSQAGDV